MCPAQVQALSRLAKRRHEPSCHMGKGREGAGKEHFLGFARVWCVQLINGEGGKDCEGVRGSTRPARAGRLMAAVGSFESSELAANPLLHGLSCRRKSYDSGEKYVV